MNWPSLHSDPLILVTNFDWESIWYIRSNGSWGFSGSSAGKQSACSERDTGSIPGLGRSPREGIGYPLQYSWASLVAQTVNNPPAIQETWVQFLHWEDPLEEGMATHCSILAWRVPMDRRAEHGGLQSVGLQRVGHNWVTKQKPLIPPTLWENTENTAMAETSLVPVLPVQWGDRFVTRESDEGGPRDLKSLRNAWHRLGSQGRIPGGGNPQWRPKTEQELSRR